MCILSLFKHSVADYHVYVWNVADARVHDPSIHLSVSKIKSILLTVRNSPLPFFFSRPTYLPAEKDSMTAELYERPVAVADFHKHCAQRRKYPVLMKLEFNSAIRDREMVHTARHGMRRANQDKNQNPRIIPCECIFVLP